MLFHRCGYKNSCFNELAYNSSANLMIISLRFKNEVFILNALDFVLLVLKLCPIEVIISLLL